MLFRYGCVFVIMVSMFLFAVCIVMSSAYIVILMSLGGCGMSDVYMLNSVGERTPPWGTPDVRIRVLDLVPWYVV